jgi:PAS domain S-box-containing protein
VTTLYPPEPVDGGMMIRSMQGRINFWNHGAEELYGWRKEEVQGRVSHDLLQTQFPKPLEEIETELIRNGQWKGKLVHITRDGRRVIVVSRWSLEFNQPLGAVVEINTPSTDVETDAGIDRGKIGTQEPVPTRASIKSDGVLSKIASICLAGGAFLCFLLACYAFTRSFNDSTGTILYGFVPVGIAGLLIASLSLKPDYKINLALVCVSLAASVYGMELLVGSLNSGPKDPLMLDLHRSRDRNEEAAQLSEKFRVPIDPRNAAEALADLNKKGLGAIPFVSPSNNLFVEQDGYRKSVINVGGAEVIPLAGISRKLTLLCNENGEWINYRSDQHGFNNPDTDIWKSGTVDIAAVGDSFPQGYCVPTEKSFMGRIRQRFPLTLNLSIAGDGPLMELATIREYLGDIKPKIVLWFYCEDNDLVELQGERRTALLPRYLESKFTQSLATRQNAIDDAITKDIPRQKAILRADQIRRQQYEPKLTDFVSTTTDTMKLTALRSRLNMPHVIEPEELAILRDMGGPNLDVFAQVLAQAKSRVNASNGKIIFVYLPSWARYAKIYRPEIKHRAQVISIVNSLGIPIIDIGHVFDHYDDPLSLFPFREFGHYNEIGHRLVAEELLKHLSFNQASLAEPQLYN